MVNVANSWPAICKENRRKKAKQTHEENHNPCEMLLANDRLTLGAF